MVVTISINVVSSVHWKSPHNIKEVYLNVDNIGNKRDVFNISH
jgi:mRNA-degrading endonuclease HigB of HigAB toxin-antitoxin module